GTGTDSFTPNGGTQSPQSGLTYGVDLFSVIGDALAVAGDGDTINIAEGTYTENLVVAKGVTIRGNNYGVDPNAGWRGPETTLEPAPTETSVQSSTSGTIFRLGRSMAHINVTIDGLVIDGHNPGLTGGRTLNGIEVDTGAGIVNSVGSFDSNPG